MMAVGICTKTRPTFSALDESLQHLIHTEDSDWDTMGHWDKKSRFTKAQLKRKKAVANPRHKQNCHPSKDFTGPPRNMTEHIYIDHAIHPSTPFAHFSGGPIMKNVLGQNLYADFADTIDKFKRPYVSGTEETGLKEDGYFLFVYTVIKT
jgi:hypothetical protein